MVRCRSTFTSTGDFRASYVLRGRGSCFVAHPEDVPEGTEVAITLQVADQGPLELRGRVQRADFDEHGNGGVLVELSEDSADRVSTLDRRLPDGGDAPTQMRRGPIAATTAIESDLNPLAGLYGDTLATPSPTVGRARRDDEHAEEPILKPGEVIEGRFLIEAHLATGGMGEVYRANHVHLNRPVAVKLLRRALASDPDMWARFQREAQLVSQLESPHVVRTFDFGRTADGQAYLAMEFVEGHTLDAELVNGPMEPARAVEVLTQVCVGLAEAHALGVIHRDLKPPNLIIGHRRDGSEIVKILDFGIARLADQSERSGKKKLTQMGFVVGTPAYIAPEQALSDDLDQRTDIYALGCVAYELLTGNPPFVSDELSKIISMQLTAAPAPLESVRPELAQHPGLCAAVLKALSKERTKRFATVKEFAAALVGPAPVPLARPVPAPDPSAPRLPSITAPGAQPTAPAALAPAPPVRAAPLLPLSAFVSPAVAARFEATREAAAIAGARKGVFIYVEVLGAPPDSAPGRACTGRMLEAFAARDGFLDTRDAGGVLVGFVSKGTWPVGRATTALLAARDALVDEAAALGAPVQMRATMLGSDLQAHQPVLSAGALDRARVIKSRLQPGQLGCEKALATDVAHVAEVAATPFGAVLNGWLPPRLPPPGLVGRDAVLESVSDRFALLVEPSPGLVLLGAEGSGRTSLATEIAAQARAANLSVTLVGAVASWKKIPGAGLAALACAACGIPFELRGTRLRPALEALQLPPPFLEALLMATQVVQQPWPFSAGQSAHALRALLHSQAGDRPVVIIGDGLEHFDEVSLEVFAELARRPLARELTLGLGAVGVPVARFEGVKTAELPELTPPDVERLVELTFGGGPGARLGVFLAREARGQPGLVHDWLQLLAARGAIAMVGGFAELVDEPPRLPRGLSPLAARVELLPPDAARVLEAAWCQGDSFDPALIAAAWPRVSQGAMKSVAAQRLVLPTAGKRWVFSSSRVAAAVGAAPSKERKGMQQRLAAAWALQAKADPTSVDPAEVARAWVTLGDGARAVPAATAAVDAALARRAPRDAAQALRVLAEALGLASAPVNKRVEALGRAVGCSLVTADVALARTLMNEAMVLAQPTQLETAELLLALCRMSRLEGKLDHARDVLERSEFLGGGTPIEALLYAERGELAEANGQPDKALEAISAGLAVAEAGREVCRLHGEVDLSARLEARLGALSVAAKDGLVARHHFETSGHRWRAVGAWPAAARALSNLSSACALDEDFDAAANYFGQAAAAAGRGGDFLFQARALLGQAKVLKRQRAPAKNVKAVAGEAWRLAGAVGWAQGRADAEALVAS